MPRFRVEGVRVKIAVCVKQVPDTWAEKRLRPEDSTLDRESADGGMNELDEDGVEVAQGEIGEVVGRSGAMMVGYHNQPGKTSEAEWYSPDGLRFIRTGDVGRFDEDGFLTLMDRKKDMIISGGFNVYPSEVEQVIWSHPAVQDCAVIGVPDADWGEAVKAMVELNPGQSVSAEELIALCKEKLGSVMAPKSVDFVAQLPRSPVGKVLKKDLRAQYWANTARRI